MDAFKRGKDGYTRSRPPSCDRRPSCTSTAGADGAGIAILPLYIALDPAIAKRLAPILPGWQPKPVVPCALYSDSSRLTPKVKVFLDFIRKYLGTDLDPRLRGTKARDCFT